MDPERIHIRLLVLVNWKTNKKCLKILIFNDKDKING